MFKSFWTHIFCFLPKFDLYLSKYSTKTMEGALTAFNILSVFVPGNKMLLFTQPSLTLIFLSTSTQLENLDDWTSKHTLHVEQCESTKLYLHCFLIRKTGNVASWRLFSWTEIICWCGGQCMKQTDNMCPVQQCLLSKETFKHFFVN